MTRPRHAYRVPARDGTFGEQLKIARLQKGMTQIALADAVTDLGLSLQQSEISSYELDKHRPAAATINALETVLGLKPGTLAMRAGWQGADAVVQSMPAPGSLVITNPHKLIERIVNLLLDMDESQLKNALSAVDFVAHPQGGAARARQDRKVDIVRAGSSPERQPS